MDRKKMSEIKVFLMALGITVLIILLVIAVFLIRKAFIQNVPAGVPDNKIVTETDTTPEPAEIIPDASEIDVPDIKSDNVPISPEELNPMLADVQSLLPNSDNSTKFDVELPIELKFDNNVLKTGMTINEFLSNFEDLECDLPNWTIDELRINNVLSPRQETYVYLVSDYWSSYAASPDVTLNNGDVLIFVRNNGEEDTNIADCEIWRFSISYSDLLLDKFTERPEIEYLGLSWGASFNEAKAIIDFSDAEFEWFNFLSRYTFKNGLEYKIWIDFDQYDRFSGISILANN